MDKIKSAFSKENLKTAAKYASIGIVAGLAFIGAVVVVAAVDGAIQQKLDPEGFEKEWNAEMDALKSGTL